MEGTRIEIKSTCNFIPQQLGPVGSIRLQGQEERLGLLEASPQ